ncbi:MAG: translational GTPase TypA [Bacillota bacterium]|nr:translational GTPase TypA [Bacillota bacterium]
MKEYEERAADRLRNIAIIAHVDHGKTTLVDAMLRQSGIFRANEAVAARVMDSNDLERERGITILAKNTAVSYGDWRINIVDTPGHADFGGEVERVLRMVDGVLLVVDAADGPMPQTRFVLRKALERHLVPVVVLNKIDRSDARPQEVNDEIFELFMELGADDETLDYPVLYASARSGLVSADLEEARSFVAQEPAAAADSTGSIRPLLDAIIAHVPPPTGDPDRPLQLLVSNLIYDNYVGRIAVGRIEHGCIQHGQTLALVTDGRAGVRSVRIGQLMRFEGLERVNCDMAEAGEIVAVSGIDDISIGDTLTAPEAPVALPFVAIDEPTLSLTFLVNDSPFAGRDGDYVTSRHLRARLLREMETNVAMRLEETDSPDRFVVKGRGELHFSILMEAMRREGYEFQVSKPEVIVRERDGVRLEPVEELVIDVPEDYVGVVIEKLGRRRATLVDMRLPERAMSRLIFHIPTRGLIGYRSEFLTDTRGNGVMNSTVVGFEPWAGAIAMRGHGVLVAHEQGEATTYGLYQAQNRGVLLIGPATPVYEGMIVGTTQQTEDVVVNVCRKKHVTNIRAAGSDEALRLSPPLELSLEQCLELIDDDELIEVTPHNIRLRKAILASGERARRRSRSRRGPDGDQG